MTWTKLNLEKLFSLREDGYTWEHISHEFNVSPNNCRKAYYRESRKAPVLDSLSDLKVLVFDIETAPLEVFCWGLWQQNISLDMVIEDCSIISWSAKWLGKKEVMYSDVRGQKNLRNDKRIVKELWKLLNEADMVLTQNGRAFDVKIFNARLVKYDIPEPSAFENIDTLKIARQNFKFISNKLAYMTGNLCTDNVKSGHKKFPGFLLWKECMKDNLEAWNEMKSYNKMDVLSLEELYLKKLKKWDKSKIYEKARKRKAGLIK